MKTSSKAVQRRDPRQQVIRRAAMETLEGRRLLSFAAAVDYTVGAQPKAMIKADFNGDGRADLVTANVTGDSVSVLLGNANGTFAAAALNSVTGDSPVALAAGHFNGDGKLDLVTANAAGFSVLLGNGNGTFVAPTTTAIAGSTPTSAVVGDLNADGKIDLIVASNIYYPGHYGTTWDPYSGWYTWYPAQWTREVRVMMGNGAGSFAAPVTSTQTFSPSAISSMVLADFNGDAKLDRASSYAGLSYGEISLALGNGLGGFGAEGFFYVPGAARAAAAGDLNADGKTDLVTANTFGVVSVLLGNGTGGFAANQSYTAGNSPVSIAIADFNGDANPDLATANDDNSLSILLGAGTGTFKPPMTLRAGTGASGIVAGDFNGDGRADVAIANSGANNVGVRLNDLAWPALTAPSLSVNDVTLAEGNTGTVNATFTVTLSAASTQTVVVDYFTAAGPTYPWETAATAGVDYTDAAGTLTFAPGQTSKTFTVAVKGDRTVEQSEVFNVRLIAPSNAFLADAAGQGAITDNEPRVTLEPGSRAEGNTGTAPMTFTVRLAEAYDLPVTLSYATADPTEEEAYWAGIIAATAGTDYLATTGAVTIPAGQTSATFTVLVKGDRTVEYDEGFFVSLQNSSAVHMNNARVVGTIVEDEPYATVASPTGFEGQPQSLKFDITLSYPSDLPVTVSYETVDYGSAVAGSDYQATSGTVTFEPGQTTRTVIVPVKDDHLAESDEYLMLNLTGATNAGLIEYTNGYGTIRDDEPRIEVDNVNMIEGTSGTKLMTFTARLTTPYDQAVSVQYQTYNSYAVAPGDYVAASGTLNFAPGQTARTFTVAIVGDNKREANESFYVLLSAPSSNAMIAIGQGYGQILDDDNGQFKKWVGPAGGNWSTAGNWSPNGVPGANDRVLISGGSVSLAASANVKELYLDNSARLAIASSTGTRVLRTTLLTIASDSRLDVGNSDVIIDYDLYSQVGWWNPSGYYGLMGQIASGNNSGAWNGNGIITSQPAALNGLTTVGIGEARDALGVGDGQTALFSGQTVDSTTTLLKYTYAGDANFDGQIDAGDYGILDFFIQAPNPHGYCFGDFNHDGQIDAMDYGIIDYNIQVQGVAL